MQQALGSQAPRALREGSARSSRGFVGLAENPQSSRDILTYCRLPWLDPSSTRPVQPGEQVVLAQIRLVATQTSTSA